MTAFGTGTDGDLEKGTAHSYTDNGDGTITDNVTGLMWEKKSADGSIHDWQTRYSWSAASYGGTNVMDGTIATTLLAGLNAGSGFAGHTDWRIPNAHELQSILNYENTTPSVDTVFNNNCTMGCTVTSCSCTATFYYWSSTTWVVVPQKAMNVEFSYSTSERADKNGLLMARAVRGG